MEFIEKIEEILKKAKDDPNFLNELKANPSDAIQKIVGVDIPEDKIIEIVTAVKAKLAAESLGGDAAEIEGKVEELAKGALDGLKKLF